MIYIKLKAQKILVGKNLKAFFVCILPFLMFAVLSAVNFELIFFMKNADNMNSVVKITVSFFSLLISYFTVSSVAFIRENYFYRCTANSFVPVRICDIFCAIGVKIIKFFLFFSWSALFFTPGAVLLYCADFAKKNNYTKEVYTTLLISAVATFLVAIGCFFVMWGRYSKTYFVQFKTGETNPLKVLAESEKLLEKELLKYAIFRISFAGWGAVSLTLLPLIYVLPYRKCADYVFFGEKKEKIRKEVISEKPIVFIFG